MGLPRVCLTNLSDVDSTYAIPSQHDTYASAHLVLAKIGQLVPLEAKSDQSAALNEFLLAGHSLLSGNQEPETLQWYAVKYETPTPTYAIIDAFAAESGRQAHINGKVAEALIANSDKLLAKGPDIPAGAFSILASKLPPSVSQADVKKGLAVGLRVLIKAKQDQVQNVREFLQVSMFLGNTVQTESEAPSLRVHYP